MSLRREPMASGNGSIARRKKSSSRWPSATPSTSHLTSRNRTLDRYLEFYNRERAHQGYRTQGRTPCQAFLDGVSQIPNVPAQEQSLMSKEVVA